LFVEPKLWNPDLIVVRCRRMTGYAEVSIAGNPYSLSCWRGEAQNQHRNFEAFASCVDLQQLSIDAFERARL
jgi:hypothetical protein